MAANTQLASASIHSMEAQYKLVLLLLAACAVVQRAAGELYDTGQNSVPVEARAAISSDQFDKVFVFAGRNITTSSRAKNRACLVLSGNYDQINEAFTLPTQSDAPAICPLYASYNLKLNHDIYYRRGITDNAEIVAQIEHELNSLLGGFNTPDVKLTDLIMHTWSDISITGCTEASCRNTFQSVIAIAGMTTYLILNYEKIGGAGFYPSSPEYSLAGINLGDSQGFEHLPFSKQPLETIRRLTDYGTGTAKGRYYYRISTHKPQRLGCFDMSTLQPTIGVQPLTLSTYNMDIYGGYRLLVQGPCFNFNAESNGNRISCSFARLSSQGQQTWENSTLYRLDNYTGVCLSPRTPKVDLGWTTVAISLTNDNNWHYSSPAYIAALSDSDMPVKLNGEKANWLSVSPSNRVSFSWTSSSFGNVAIGTAVHYLIVGYRKVNGVVEAVEFPAFQTGSPTTNTQIQDIDLKTIRCSSNCDGVAIGQIVVRLATGIQNTTATRYEISSPVIPIGWYTYFANDANRISQLCKDNLGQQIAPLTCPCSSRVATAETGKFIPAPDCDHSGRNCFYSDNTECYVTLPNQVGAGLRCCYATPGNYLIYGQDTAKRGSFTMQYAPLTSSLQQNGTSASISYLLSHIVPYTACCVWHKDESKECYLYGLRHAVHPNCTDYQVSGIAAVVGDPHIITPDASIVTFNTNGEFWFLKPTSISSAVSRIQVRLTRAFASTSGLRQTVSASVLSAIVLAQDNHRFEIQMRTKSLQQTKKLHLYHNGKEVIFFDIKEQVYPGMRVTTNGPVQSSINVMATNDGTSLQCDFDMIDGFSRMTCIVFIQSVLKNQTSGLIGSWNGIPTDDLTKQGSSEVYSLTNLTDVDEVGRTWVIKSDESLFTYISTTFQENALGQHRPVLTYTPNDQICGGSSDLVKQSCSYDLSVTKSQAFAQNTRAMVTQTLDTRNNLSFVTNTEYCPYLDIVGANKEVHNGYRTNFRVSVTGCKSGYAPRLNGSQTGTFLCIGPTWNPAPTALCIDNKSELAVEVEVEVEVAGTVAVTDAVTDVVVVIVSTPETDHVDVIKLIVAIVSAAVGVLVIIIVLFLVFCNRDDAKTDGNTNAVKLDDQLQVVYGQQAANAAKQRVAGEGQQKVNGEEGDSAQPVAPVSSVLCQ